MRGRNAECVLREMIKRLLNYVEELSIYRNEAEYQFEYGERTAYTECLEWIQTWTDAENYGLNFNIEDKYPL